MKKLFAIIIVALLASCSEHHCPAYGTVYSQKDTKKEIKHSKFYTARRAVKH